MRRDEEKRKNSRLEDVDEQEDKIRVVPLCLRFSYHPLLFCISGFPHALCHGCIMRMRKGEEKDAGGDEIWRLEDGRWKTEVSGSARWRSVLFSSSPFFVSSFCPALSFPILELFSHLAFPACPVR